MTRVRQGSNAGDQTNPPPSDSPSGSDALTIEEVVSLLEKGSSRNEAENGLLQEWSFLVPLAEARIKGKLAREVLKQRTIEQEESIETIETKAHELANLISNSNYVVIYTGAGISTSASIPDYRGPNGLWTQIRKTGTFSMTQFHDLSNAEPTLTHMAIRELCRRRIVRHVVSQNCDGLHLRSGIAQNQLSEIHGNMYIEVCPTCEKQYFRQADITEKTRRFRHKTGRKCHTCSEPNNNLIDTIVLYGERSRTKWPMNWERAGRSAKKADLIICLGSSLKTLRRYGCLWPKRISNSHNNKLHSHNHKSAGEPAEQTKLAIINLQYTPKDKNAVLKINGKCDLVMQLVMKKLNMSIPSYDWKTDPLMELAVPFSTEERQKLGRNLMFEAKQRQLRNLELSTESFQNNETNTTNETFELSQSPSLFVSEITDGPSKKSLRMRIRAVNSTPPPLSDLDNSSACITTMEHNEPTLESDNPVNQPEVEMMLEAEDKDSVVVKQENLTDERQLKSHLLKSFALPGWLGKGIGNSRTSSYRRKRHGNKGRKHPSVKSNSAEEEAVASPITTGIAADPTSN